MKWFRVRVTEDAGQKSHERKIQINEREISWVERTREGTGANGPALMAARPWHVKTQARHCSRLYPARLPVPLSLSPPLSLSARECVSLCCVQCLALLLGAESPQVFQQGQYRGRRSPMASYFKQGIYAGASSGPDGRAPPNGTIHLCVCMDDA
jgi:hypothetical protein